MHVHEHTAISTALHPPKFWEEFTDGIYSILKRTHLENYFNHINNLHQNTNFAMEEENNNRTSIS